MKNIRMFYLKIFIFGGKIFSVFEEACFRNGYSGGNFLYAKVISLWKMAEKYLVVFIQGM